jgi:hypothetical protein
MKLSAHESFCSCGNTLPLGDEPVTGAWTSRADCLVGDFADKYKTKKDMTMEHGGRVMTRPDLKQLADAVRQAEAELEAAKTLVETKAAAKKLVRAKGELKAAQESTSNR